MKTLSKRIKINI